MFRLLLRFGLVVSSFGVTAVPALAQVQWNVTYADGSIGAGGIGFADPTVSGSTTIGQLRRNSIAAATTYLGTVIDGRGTMNLSFGPSLTNGTGFQAQFGPDQILTSSPGSFQNGGLYQAARTNQHVFAGSPDGGGQFNFGYGWNYDGQPASALNFDMVSVAIHEITHGLGFLSFTNVNGNGLAGTSSGTPDVYSGFDRYLQTGNGPGGALINTNIANSGFGTFTGAANTLTSGNDATNGLFFGGAYTREVLSGPAPLYAPSSYEDKSTASHVADSNALMSPTFALNTVKKLKDFEIAMLMDIGWNVYNWNGTDGNWADGANNVNQSRWRTNLGIVTNGSQEFNTFANSGQAPVLPVYGQVTSNIVLNFGGSGSTGYTATNNIGTTVRLVRLNLDSTSTQTNTITGGTLLFGQNSDGTSAVLAPKIVQQNSGNFAVNSNLQIPIGLTVDGSGTGQVSLGGAISGNGGLAKAGAFTLELNGSSANTFAGPTTVNAGILLLNKTPGTNALASDVTVNPGGTLRLGGMNQLPSSGVVHLAGGTLSTGAGSGFSDSIGSLQMTADSTISLGSGSHALTFSGFSGTPAGTLTVMNWSGNTGGQLFFENLGSDLNTINTTYASFLANVQFAGFGSGGTYISTGISGTVELVPAPEPLTVLGIAAGALGVAGLARRRSRQSEYSASR